MGFHSSEVKTHQLLLSFLTTEVPQLLLITLECCLRTPAASRPPRACPGKDLLSRWSLSPAPSSQNSPSYKKRDLHRVPQVRSPELGTGRWGAEGWHLNVAKTKYVHQKRVCISPLHIQSRSVRNSETARESLQMWGCCCLGAAPEPWIRLLLRRGCASVLCVLSCNSSLEKKKTKCKVVCVTEIRKCLSHLSGHVILPELGG